MNESIRVTVLVENTAVGRGVRGEHGLACWIETSTQRILFDTGQTREALFHNAHHLGIDLAAADAVVLSHGHYDHTGGLAEVLHATQDVRVFMHPEALARRFSRGRDGTVQAVGIPPEIDEDFLRAHSASLTLTCGATLVTERLWVTGGVPRLNAYEDTGGDFFLDAACTRPDPIADDQALFFDTRDGVVVLLGCGHAGAVNTLRYVQQLTGMRPIHAVMGGLHLIHASEDRLSQTVDTFRGFDLGLLAPAHCTGARAQSRLRSEFQDCWEPCHVGTRFEFPTETVP